MCGPCVDDGSQFWKLCEAGDAGLAVHADVGYSVKRRTGKSVVLHISLP